MKILLGYDGSDCADFALEDLRKAGLPETGEAIVLSVAEAWELPVIVDRVSARSGSFVHPSVGLIESHLAEVVETAKKLADSACNHILESFPKWKVTAQGVCGNPAVELINKADDWKPDLLIVGSQGRSAIGRFFIGSVSHKVLTEARCSVRIVKKTVNKSDHIQKILVCVDGSANSEAVAREIVRRSWQPETVFRLLAVNNPFSRAITMSLIWNFAEDRPEETDESREWIEKVVNMPKRILDDAGLKTEAFIRWGDAGNRILREAEEWQASCIFLGARGLSPIKRFLLGSVSSYVAVKAACTVEVVRHQLAY